jgi:MFS family permease
LAGCIGRVNTLLIAITIFTSMSILCGMSHHYSILIGFRFFQGIGLGGEVPVAAVIGSRIAGIARRSISPPGDLPDFSGPFQSWSTASASA